jgi:hypothetical protein
MEVRVNEFEEFPPIEGAAYRHRLFTITEGKAGNIARQYEDEPAVIDFLCRLDGSNRLMLAPVPCEDDLFCRAVAHLMATAKARKIRILLADGYHTVHVTGEGALE